MLRALIWLALTATTTPACSLCGDAFTRRQSLRQHFGDAKVVLHGQLKNPKPNPDGLGGTTELHVSATLKTDAAFAAPTVIVIPRYVPVVGAPVEYLMFCSFTDGKLDPVHGVEATATATKYLATAAKLDAKNPSALLAFCFAHLESADEVVAADAFHEFARAADTAIQAGAAGYDRVKIRAWIADPKVPEERLGVYSLLLGLCGSADDAAWLKTLLTPPRAERLNANLGGLLAGLTILDTKSGWSMTQQLLAAPEISIGEKLSAVGTLRYFQATRPTEARPGIIAGYKTLLNQSDLADVAIDDLRRFALWDLSADVLKSFDSGKSPLMKRGIVRYALSSNDAAAKAFIEQVRGSDPKLIERVEKAR